MKAHRLIVGDTVDGWNVTALRFAAVVTIDNEAGTWTNDLDAVVLLSLERQLYLGPYDVNGERDWYVGAPPNSDTETKAETRRRWFRADEEVER